MPAKTQDQQRRADIESAITGLYSQFPDVASCRRASTREVIDIEAQIAARKEELAKDRQLVALEKKRDAARKKVVERSKDAQKRIAALHRELRLRGESEKLLSAVEKIAAEEPIVLFEYDCR